MRGLFGKGRYANVTATLALITAMGGTSYAAATLADNSVGTSQLKADAVTSAKVKNGSLMKADFKAGQIPAGARGAEGPSGPAGAAGAAGPAGPLVATLPSGQTLRGYVEPWGEAAEIAELATASVSFAFPLGAAPAAHFIPFGTANPVGCTGTPTSPEASPGHLCVWELDAATNATGQPRGIATGSAPDLATRFGFSGFVRSAGVGQYHYRASWAVTAP